MKSLLIASIFLGSFGSAFAMEGSGKDVTRCVANAINKAIYSKLKEKASTLTTRTSAHQIHRETSIRLRWGEDEEITLAKKSVSLKKLNFLLTEDQIINGLEVKNGERWDDDGVKVRTSLHVKKVNFEMSSSADGVLKYQATANLKDLVREYNNEGNLEIVRCSLVNANIRSAHTQAILLKSE